MRQFYPTVAPSRTFSFSRNDIKGELFIFPHIATTDMEFYLATHLIMLLPGGVSGLCKCNIGDRFDQFRSPHPNTIIFNPAHRYLRLKVTNKQDEWRALLLTIEPRALRRLGNGAEASGELSPQIGVDDPVACQALAAIQEEIEKPSGHSRLYAEAFLTLTLKRLHKHHLRNTPQPPPDYVKGGLANWRLKRALQVIESKSNKMPQLSEMADAAHLHQASFCRAFKQSLGQSPHHYLLIDRINRAKEMMKDPERSLTDIAFSCGFSSSSQFSVVFKRIVGRPPRNYRYSA